MAEATISFLYCLVWVCLAVAWSMKSQKSSKSPLYSDCPHLLQGIFGTKCPCGQGHTEDDEVYCYNSTLADYFTSLSHKVLCITTLFLRMIAPKAWSTESIAGSPKPNWFYTHTQSLCTPLLRSYNWNTGTDESILTKGKSGTLPHLHLKAFH